MSSGKTNNLSPKKMYEKLLTNPWISKLESRKVVIASTLTPHINTDQLYSMRQIGQGVRSR